MEVPMGFAFSHTDGREQESFSCDLHIYGSHVPMAGDNFFLPNLKVASGVSAGAMRGTELGDATPGPQPSLTAHYQVAFTQKQPGAFPRKYLYPPLLEQDPPYYASTSGSFMGRASCAASRILVTRDPSGKGRLNTSYFLRVLTSVASATAHRPYWARSTSTTFNNFGSKIGSDAGINVFHAFRPGIRQIVKAHAPRFASRLAERITHDQIPRGTLPIPAR